MRLLAGPVSILILSGLLSCGPSGKPPAIVLSGSSTVAPLAEALIGDYLGTGRHESFSVDSIGTRAGFERFIEGSCDIVSASRPITADEISRAAAAGREAVGFTIAMDSVVICTGGAVHGDVSREELIGILTREFWSDVRPDWPERPVTRYYPGVDSGTFAFVAEVLFQGDTSILLATSNLQLSEDDHVLVQGLIGDPVALGFFGYSYYLEQNQRISALTIDGIGPDDGSRYALSRPLFLYTDRSTLSRRPEVSEFIGYVLGRARDGRLPAGFSVPDSGVLEQEMERFGASGGVMR